MPPIPTDEKKDIPKVKPLCPVFGDCGGCRYQDLPYEDELRLKEEGLKAIFKESLGVGPQVFAPMVASPQSYHYRNRLDLKLIRNKDREIFIGFSPEARYRVIPVDSCPIALPQISDFIPELKKHAAQMIPAKYKVANLVVRAGDDARVVWGGIGRRSLQMKEEDYLSTEIDGKRIFYSLDTFFQANLSILPRLIAAIRALGVLSPETVFYDLYSGVGLFGIMLADMVRKVVMIEEVAASTRLARYNIDHHKLGTVELVAGKVEEELPPRLEKEGSAMQVAMIDPPRGGLSASVVETLNRAAGLSSLIYLSCHPETLARDLAVLTQEKWRIEKVIPFDFFPKTKHIETLVLLKPGEQP